MDIVNAKELLFLVLIQREKYFAILFYSFFSVVTCSSPPEVKNARMLGNSKDRYPVNSIVRYQCDSGFIQRHLSVVRCLPDGQWEEPQVECIGGKYMPHTLEDKVKVSMLCFVE